MSTDATLHYALHNCPVGGAPTRDSGVGVFNWNDVRVLLEVWRTGTVTGAAATLGLDSSTVTRRIKTLERDLGMQCFERHSGRLVLTAEALPILEQAQRIEEAAVSIERTAHPTDSPASGRVRVSSTRTMASAILLPAAESLAQTHPDVTLEVDSNVQRIDLMQGQGDVALTCYPVEHPRLIQRLSFCAGYALYGSQTYFDAYGTPADPGLGGHRIIGMGQVNESTSAGRWWQEHACDAQVTVRSTSAEDMLRMCVEGRALSLLFCFRAAAHPELRRVEGFPLGAMPHWLVVHPEMQHEPRVRAVIDALDLQVAQVREVLEGGSSDAVAMA